MPRPIRCLIDAAAAARNLAVARRHAHAAKVWAVVKANAYGHGIERVYPGLREADGFALLDLDEAARLRQLGWSGPILMLEGAFTPADLTYAYDERLTLVVHHLEQIRMLELAQWSDAASGAGSLGGRAGMGKPRPLNLYLKLNSGMNRLGFDVGGFRAAHARLAALPQVGGITLMTHFADADRAHGADAAIERFQAATQGLEGERSMANSAATLAHPAAIGDWVRPGVMLYGATPFADRPALELGLAPVMRLESELISVRDLAPGDTLGYGSRFQASRPMRVGVVACGYADGYPRIAADGAPVAVGGQITTLIGQVSMDMITVDLTALPTAVVGTPVQLWGDLVPVDAVAAAAGTVGYELLCAVAARVPMLEYQGDTDCGV